MRRGWRLRLVLRDSVELKGGNGGMISELSNLCVVILDAMCTYTGCVGLEIGVVVEFWAELEAKLTYDSPDAHRKCSTHLAQPTPPYSSHTSTPIPQ
jgi:hypothetical protein